MNTPPIPHPQTAEIKHIFLLSINHVGTVFLLLFFLFLLSWTENYVSQETSIPVEEILKFT